MASSQNAVADRKVKVFIDYSNLWIAAMKTAATNNNRLTTDYDHRIRCEIRFLIKLIKENCGQEITASDVNLFGSYTESEEAEWKESKQKWEEGLGYIVNFSRRNPDIHGNKEFDVDKNMREAIEGESDAAYIAVVSGDHGFIPVIEVARGRGCTVEVYSWRDALSGKFRKSGVTVVHLTDEITFVNRKFPLAALKDKEKMREKFVRVVLHMRPDSSTCKPYHEPSVEWCRRLEELIGFPYQYYWRNGSSDDLVLVFRRTNIIAEREMRFDADKNFLDSRLDVIRQEHYCDAEFELIKGESRCPHKLCCKYLYRPDDPCDYLHNQREKYQFGRSLQRKKIEYCLRYAQDKCPETAEDCQFAHGENDALCPSCGKTGHFEYYCQDKQELNHKSN